MLHITCVYGVCKGQSTYFNRSYYFNSFDYLSRTEWFTPLLEIPSQGFISAGRSWNFNTGDTKIFILKTNYYGDTLLTKAFGDSGSFYQPQDMSYTPDSNIIMVVAKASYLTDTTWFYLVKININGDTLWTRLYSSGFKKTNSRKVTNTRDGGYLLCGWTGKTSNQKPTYGYVVKTDSLGSVEWDKQYGDSTKFNVATCALELNDGGYFILLWTSGQNTLDRDILLIRTDSRGNELWQQTYGTSGMFDYGEWINKLNDGKFLITGSQGAVAGITHAWLIKIDNSANVIFQKNYGLASAYTEFNKMIELNDGSLVMSGHYQKLSSTKNLGWLYKTNAFGDSIWDKTYSYDSNLMNSVEYLWDMIPTSDKGFLLAGQTNPGPTGTQDAWLLKVDSLGCEYAGCIPVGINETVLLHKEETIFLFPNPTSNFSNIKLPGSLFNQICELSIIDINGKIIYTDSFLPDYAMFTYPLRTGNLPSGMYLVKVKSLNKEFSVKLLKNK